MTDNEASTITNIPTSFEKIPDRGPFIQSLGALYRLKDADKSSSMKFGFMPNTLHINGLGFIHGGVISTLADSFMAQAIADKFKQRLVTTELNIEFLNAFAPNRWIQSEVILQQTGDNKVSAKTELIARGRVCAKADANYKLFNR